MLAATLYGVVFGSLLASSVISDCEWKIPRRPYHMVLATGLLLGFVADALRERQAPAPHLQHLILGARQ